MNFLQNQIKNERNQKYFFDGLYFFSIIGILYYGLMETFLHISFLGFLSYITLYTLLSNDPLYKRDIDIDKSKVYSYEFLLKRWTLYGFYYFSSFILDYVLVFPIIGTIYYYLKLAFILWTLKNNNNMEIAYNMIVDFIMGKRLLFEIIEGVTYFYIYNIKERVTTYTGISFEDLPKKKVC